MVQVGEKRNLMKYFYPAIFTLDRKKNEFRAVFPDLTGCAVKAESMAEAARKAREALGMALMELEEKGIEFPAASDECALQRAYPYCQVGVVLLDMNVYRAYREYRMEQAELDSAEWAEKSKRRRSQPAENLRNLPVRSFRLRNRRNQGTTSLHSRGTGSYRLS